MNLELAGKTVVITGASKGIGLAIARAFGREHSQVVLVAREQSSLDRATEEVTALGGVAVPFQADVTDREAARRLADFVVDRFGQIDILVGNVGGNRRGRFLDTTDADWEAVLDLNLRAHLSTVRALVPVMNEGGAITFIASIFGREAGGAGLSIYNSTKSALISFAKILALELVDRDIRVNSVAPGSIRFPGSSWDRRCIEDPEGMAVFTKANLPMGRFGRAEEVADVVAFLSSARAAWVNGACVNVDGLQSKSLI